MGDGTGGFLRLSRDSIRTFRYHFGKLRINTPFSGRRIPSRFGWWGCSAYKNLRSFLFVTIIAYSVKTAIPRFRLHLVFKFMPHLIPHPSPLSSLFYRANQRIFGWRGETNRGGAAPSLNSLPLSNMLKNGQFNSPCLRGVHPEGDQGGEYLVPIKCK